ncbi:ras guanine nucleotide exchange factor i-related [Anaeramoeba flamelloides]|uniref:Ras guanine nucleotide exchange factor i-related n=1 Tax=Anaeramoeba flamelloides TaxID=1746091 RepID=A0ABQ8ZCQ4_9EUKA|nr:ras guanine nucleotide exchange factor i-related [Anaeramoeba flamelloides]
MTNRNFEKFGNTKKFPVLLRKKHTHTRTTRNIPSSTIQKTNTTNKEQELGSSNTTKVQPRSLEQKTQIESVKDNKTVLHQVKEKEQKNELKNVSQNKFENSNKNFKFSKNQQKGSNTSTGFSLKQKMELTEPKNKVENKPLLKANTTNSTRTNSTTTNSTRTNSTRTNSTTTKTTTTTTVNNSQVSDEKLITNQQKIQNETQKDLLLEKKYWLANIMKTHPKALEIRERTRSFTKLTSFGKLIKTGQTECKDQTGGNLLLEMIINFLQKKGCSKTIQSLLQESGLNINNYYSENDQLRTILQMAIKNVENVWDLDLNNCVQSSKIKHPESIDLNDKIDLLSEEGDSLVNDLNIWDEPEDNKDNYLPPQNKQDQYPFFAVTLNKLIEKITFVTGMKPRFLYVFLMTYQSFTTPGKLLYKLFQRYDVPKSLQSKFPNEKEFENFKRIIQIKTVNLLKLWIERHFLDFNQGFLDEIAQWIGRETKKNSKNCNLFNQITSLIELKSQKDSEQTNSTNYTKEAPEPKIPKNIFSKNLKLFDIDELEIARQISIIDFELFSKIKKAELLNCAWSKEKLKNRATNVLALMNRFEKMKNQFSNLIITEDRVKNRVKILNKIIKIAEHLYKLNNFHSLMGLLEVIDAPEIKRLNFTLNEIPPKYMEILQNLQQLMKGHSNYINYRKHLLSITSSCIPYIKLILNDLTEIDKQHSDFVNNKLINFKKKILIYDSIEVIQRFQLRNYILHPVEQICNLLKNMEIRSQKELFAISQMREPKNAIRREIKF